MKESKKGVIEEFILSNVIEEIIYDIHDNNKTVDPRGLKTKELLLYTSTINPLTPFANFPHRNMNWKYFAGELAWYLNKNNNVEYISKFSNFWNNIKNEGTNEINSNYGSLLFGTQLEWALNALKDDINTRQSIAFLNQPKFQVKGNKDFVCTMYLNFFVRENELHMKVQMRSNDVFYGLTYDAPIFSIVHQHMRLWLLETYPDLKLGVYYHCADNIHYYERHFALVDNILNTENKETQYAMRIENPLFNIKNGEMIKTDECIEMINSIDIAVENKSNQNDYRIILSKYLNIKEIE